MAREDIMTEEKILLADKVLDWYKSAHRDKDDRGIFDLWERVETYWEGSAHNVNHGDDINTNVNIIHPTVEGQVALLVNNNYQVKVKPVTPSDSAYAKYAEILLDWIKDKNKLFKVIDSHERRREKFGTGILRVIFDPDFENGYGLPKIESINPAYVFCDPKITDPAKINDGEFIIETMRKPISWANRYYGAKKADNIVKNYDPSGSIISKEEMSTYLHILCWTRTGGKLRLLEVTGCGILLYDSFEKMGEKPFYQNNSYPYFFTPLYMREGSVWAKGDAELLISLQDLIDELDDQIRSNARLSANPQRLVDISCNIDLDKWTNDSGLIIPTANIDGAKYLSPPEMPDYPLERRQQALHYERQIISRFSDQLAGTSDIKGRTATEIASAVSQASLAMDYKRKMLCDTLSSVFSFCFSLALEYYTGKKAYRVTDGEFVWISAADFNEIPVLDKSENGELVKTDNSKKQAEFDISVEVL